MQEISSCSFGNDLNQLTSSLTTQKMQTPHNVLGMPLDGTCVTTDNSNAAYLAVYRPSGTQYSLVSGSSSNYSVSPIMSGYNCSHFSIPQSQQFVVQQGDVIAACVQPSGIRPTIHYSAIKIYLNVHNPPCVTRCAILMCTVSVQ